MKKIFILKLYDAQFGSTIITYMVISTSILIYNITIYYEMTTSKEYNFNIKIFVTAYFKTTKLNIENLLNYYKNLILFFVHCGNLKIVNVCNKEVKKDFLATMIYNRLFTIFSIKRKTDRKSFC